MWSSEQRVGAVVMWSSEQGVGAVVMWSSEQWICGAGNTLRSSLPVSFSWIPAPDEGSGVETRVGRSRRRE